MLTGISAFWFGKTGHIVPNHYISATDGVPDEVRGRAMVVQKLKMLPVECVVRGYITGSGWKDYQATGTRLGHRAAARPAGVREAADADLHAVDEGRRGPRRGDRLRPGAAEILGDRRAGRPPARRLDRAVLLRRRAGRRARRDPRRHEVRVRPRRRRRAGPRRRGADARTPRATGRSRATSPATASRASTSSTCATGRRRPAGTRRRRRPRCPTDVVAGTRAPLRRGLRADHRRAVRRVARRGPSA